LPGAVVTVSDGGVAGNGHFGGGAIGGPTAISGMLLRLCTLGAGGARVGLLELYGVEEMVEVQTEVVVERCGRGSARTCMLAGRLNFLILAGGVLVGVRSSRIGSGIAGREVEGGG